MTELLTSEIASTARGYRLRQSSDGHAATILLLPNGEQTHYLPADFDLVLEEDWVEPAAQQFRAITLARGMDWASPPVVTLDAKAVSQMEARIQ